MATQRKCTKCGKSTSVHMLVGARLACAWEKRKVTIEGDFGPDTILVVEAMYLTLGRKVPQNVALAAVRYRREHDVCS